MRGKKRKTRSAKLGDRVCVEDNPLRFRDKNLMAKLANEVRTRQNVKRVI